MKNFNEIAIANRDPESTPRIKVLGLGGAGCNTISRLHALQLSGVELIAANTDRNPCMPIRLRTRFCWAQT
jgi:cell division GTPase FtsZ